MFINNKYSKIYFNIIERAKSRSLENCYFETHHIVPRCAGGTDNDDNLVKLTAREHYVCHMLLPNMVEDSVVKSKLYHACGMMVRGNKHGRRFTSWQYQRARLYHAKGNTLRQTGKKMTLSEEERKRRGDQLRECRSLRQYGPRSEEVREKIRKANLGTPPPNKGKPATKHFCPHCKRTIAGDSNFSRWHGDNCKQNPNGKNDNYINLSSKLKGRPKPKYQCPNCDRMIGGRNNFEKHLSSCQQTTTV